MTEGIPPTGVRRPGIYARGVDTVGQILNAALGVLVDEGAAAFTLRRIAAASGMKVGNLSHHFPRKELLVQLLLEQMLNNYEKILDTTVRRTDLSAEDRFTRVIEICLDDIGTKRTTRLFTELWALANHNSFIADRVEAFYRHVHAVIGQFVAELNPGLSGEGVATVSLFISSAMEGTTMFAGFEKPWEHRMPSLKRMSVRYFLEITRTIRDSDIDPVSNKAPRPGAPGRRAQLAATD